MTQLDERAAIPIPGADFVEHDVEADGFRIRYKEAGAGAPLICLHGAGGLRLSHAHEILSQSFRVIVFEAPGFGQSAVNDRTATMKDLARTMAQATANLGIERYSLMGTSFGGRLAIWLATQFADRLDALVLVSPAAIFPETHVRRAAPESQASMLYAHPERQPILPPPDPAILAKQEVLLRRFAGPLRDAELESQFARLEIPVLVLFGTQDRSVPPEMGRIYKQILPSCHFVLVYDAGHAMDADRPEAFARVVGDFLQRHDAFIVNNQSALLAP